MAKNEKKAVAMDDWQLTSSFNSPKKQTPKGFTDLSVNDEIIVVLRGKVRSVSSDEQSNSFSVIRNSIEIIKPNEKKARIEALKKLKG